MRRTMLLWMVCLVSVTMMSGLFVGCGGNGPADPMPEDVDAAKEKVMMANEALGNAVRTLRDLDIDDINDIDQLDDISGFQTAHGLYMEALSLDPNNLDANLGTAVLEIVLLKDNEELQNMRDQWIEYLDAEPEIDDIEFPLFKVSPPVGCDDLTVQEKSLTSSLLASSKVALLDPPLASDMQRAVRETVIPAIQTALSRMQQITGDSQSGSYLFTITSEMQGGTSSEPEDPVELDLADFKAFQAALLSSRAGLRVFLAYDLDVASYDSTDIIRALEQSSDFFTLQDAAEMGRAKDDLIAAANQALEAIQFLRGEVDNQDDDFITVDPGDEDTLDEIEERINQALTSLNSEVTLTEDFDDDSSTPDASLTISLKNFFDNPPERPKELLPSYVIERDIEFGESVDQFVWTAQSIDAWVFPDPTFGGLLPAMTDAQLKSLFGITYVPGDIDLTVGSGTTPEYSWNDSPIYFLRVTRPATFEAVWEIRSQDFSDTILSPITHGTVPSNAVQTVGTELELTPGELYRVTIERSGSGIVGYQSETRDFIP